MNLRKKAAFKRPLLMTALAALAGLGVAVFAIRSSADEILPIAKLSARTHIHGLAVDRRDPSYLLIATHHGLFRAGPDGQATRISEIQDFMGFNPHPGDPNRLYASGHPAQGGNLGFIGSDDAGKTWTQISSGVDDPVDFHQLAVSGADPRTIYGVYQGSRSAAMPGRPNDAESGT